MILGVAAAVRVLALMTFEGIVHDGTTRVMVASGWLSGQGPIFGRTNWPEGNYLLPAAALAIWNEPYWSVRILFVLVGLTNVWLAYHLGRAVLGHPTAAVAGWIVALMPFHILVSADAAMSEGPYISFMLVAMLAVVRYAESPSPWLAAGAGLALTLATLFRFDGVIWGIPLALSIAYVAHSHRLTLITILRHLAVFGAVGLIYPVAIFIAWSVLYADPFHILDQGKLNAQQFFVNGKHPRWPSWVYQTYVVIFWPASTFVLMTPGVALLSWVGALAVVRERRKVAAPLVLGLVITSTWLAYAAFTHDILAQWRYALILVVVLSVFCLRGAQRIMQLVRALTPGRLAFAVGSAAVAWQALITYVAFVDSGPATRQLGILSPIRPNQFASRDMLEWIRENSNNGKAVLLTPHVLEQPYLLLHRRQLEAENRITVQSYYLPSSELVHTKETLTAGLVEKLTTVGYVATTTDLRELGLRDGLVREVVQPTQERDGSYSWNGVHLRLLQRFGHNIIWEVIRG